MPAGERVRWCDGLLVRGFRVRRGRGAYAQEMPFGREVAIDPYPGPHAVGGFIMQRRLAAREQVWAVQALLAGIGSPPGVKPVARVL